MITSRSRVIGRVCVGAALVLLARMPSPSVDVRAQGQPVRPAVVRPQPQLSAAEALRRGEYARAIEAGRIDLAAAPQSAPALALLVRAFLETGAHTDAEEAARAFISRTPKASDAWYTLGDALAARGRRTEAEAA